MKNTIDPPVKGMRGFLTGALREMMVVTGARKGSLFLFCPDTGDFELAAFLSPSPPALAPGMRSGGKGVLGKVFEGGVPVLVKDVAADPRFSPNGYAHYRTASFISIPFFNPFGKPLGLINLTDRTDGAPFGDQDFLFASTVAVYAAIIANNLEISESLEREKARLDEQKELLKRYTSVGRLAAGIVHEINNPLDGIIRFTNMLLNLQNESSLPREYLLEIKTGLSKIENVTRSLLQFSHHVNRKTMMIRNYVDLSKIVEEALIACDARSRSDVQVRRQIDIGRRILDMGLSQVFTSVVQNALDAMPRGGTLDIGASAADSLVHISFRDSGAGIREECRERIFDPFYSEKNNSSRPGLGLSKCREIIGRYNGAIDVESCPGKGSVFSITLSDKFLEHD